MLGILVIVMTSFCFGELPMKSVIFAAIAAMLVFALPAQANAPATNQVLSADAPMSPADCDKALTECKDDVCKKDLEAKGCKKQG